MHKLSANAVTEEVDAFVFDPATRGVLFIQPTIDYMTTLPEVVRYGIIACGFFYVGARYGSHLGRLRTIAQVLPALSAFERLQKTHIREHKELELRRATMDRMQGAGVDTRSYEPVEPAQGPRMFAIEDQARALLSGPMQARLNPLQRFARFLKSISKTRGA